MGHLARMQTFFYLCKDLHFPLHGPNLAQKLLYLVVTVLNTILDRMRTVPRYHSVHYHYYHDFVIMVAIPILQENLLRNSCCLASLHNRNLQFDSLSNVSER